MTKENRINENQIMRDLAKVLLRDYVGDLCYMSNKSLELTKEEYKDWAKSFLKNRIEKLDIYYDDLINSEEEQPAVFFYRMLQEFKDPIKNG